ncbi:hypothetical protein GWK47_037676 [Chionoecetes opilio]|uniref:Uncharacterized protein n=1 Tax=Chionoecetes opilio TaxID=41210 RepID=A0A8J4YLL4_CHIOP|nr:hypothetical protein GWK47_037676 [Chionoecetes opilio]
MHAKLKDSTARTEELGGQLERQQFEIGHQREMIHKLEKERQAGVHRPSPAAAFATPVLPLHPRGETEETEGPKNRLLGLHNAPPISHTRLEKLPGMEDVLDKGKDVPMWKLHKENKDYSKYKLPPQERKTDENCKTQ